MWRFLRRAILVLLVAVVLLFVFRGPVYRWAFHYEVIGERGAHARNTVTAAPKSTAPFNLDALIEAVLDTTSARLHFSTGRVTNDPVKLTAGSAANCIGYAALFKTLLEERLAGAGEADAFHVEQVVGQLHMGHFNVHALYTSAFWKDHDIVRITERSTGITVHVDPTLYDAVGIGRVTGPSGPPR